MSKYDLLFRFNKFLINLTGKTFLFFRLPKYFQLKRLLTKNRELKSLRNSETCFICGLGPSLKKIDLNQIDGDLIVVNRFHLFDELSLAKPTYYCMVDSYFYQGEGLEILTQALKRYPKSAFILNGNLYQRVKHLAKQNPNLYFSCMWNGIFTNRSKLDFMKVIPAFGNIIGVAIATAIYAGYKKIILLGTDFNSFANQRKIHCYDEENEARHLSMSFELFCYSFVADNHYELQKYAQRNGIQITNATEGSLLDAYERNDTISEYLSRE